MFITLDACKSPVSALFLGNGTSVWSATELAMQQTWFMVELEELGPIGDVDLPGSRTVLLFDFQGVEQFILSDQAGRVRLKSVHIVTPGHINGSNCWRMDQLRAVWQGRGSIENHQTSVDIFETVSGKKYPAWFSGLSVEDLVSDTLRFEFEH